jgi:hypothetical protein
MLTFVDRMLKVLLSVWVATAVAMTTATVMWHFNATDPVIVRGFYVAGIIAFVLVLWRVFKQR